MKKILGYHHLKKDDADAEYYFTDTELAVISLHADLYVCLFRCEIKLGKQMNIIRNQTTKLMTHQGLTVTTRPNPTGATGTVKGLSKGMLQKATIDKGSTSKKVKQDFKNLESTLQEAGKLQPPKPQPLPFENLLVQ